MIRLIVRLGKWLENRFPAKIVVTAADYLTLKSQIDAAVHLLPEIQANIDALIKRVSSVEHSAAHTEAVKTVILELAALKEEFTTIKTGLGLSRIHDADIQAMLNGVPLPPQE